jgi:hypothetical protein
MGVGDRPGKVRGDVGEVEAVEHRRPGGDSESDKEDQGNEQGSTSHAAIKGVNYGAGKGR